jgi:hypothetical protein
MEGRLRTNLAGARLEPKPVHPKAPLQLRIAETYPRGTLVEYDFRYVGLEPGTYDLRDHLVRADGSAVSNLPPLLVEVTGLLPAGHDGLLAAGPPSPLARLGGYRVLLVAGGVAWALLLIPLLWRRRVKAVAAPPVTGPPSLAERLRPLLADAAAGRLDTDGRARLERLLLAHWREKLALDPADLPAALRRLRAHPEAGVILHTLEAWLHRRPAEGRDVDLEPLLKPYRNDQCEM